MVQPRTRLAIARSSFARNRHDVTACNTSGSIHVASTNQAAPSLRKLSTPYLAGSRRGPYATRICQMSAMKTTTFPDLHGSQLFDIVDGRSWLDAIGLRYIRFYTAFGIEIGNKTVLGTIISEVTGIPMEVLNYSKRPDEYSVSERMAWASCRSTSRIEDRAYCLMGLFGVYMPLLCGEGEYAFQQLQKEIIGLTNQTSCVRLLVVDSRPLAIETFASRDEPYCAILSRTWSSSEVSFQDILLRKTPHRNGYQKIKNLL